jgi:hypothetical protein
LISSAASRAWCSVSATTNATGSPTCRTRWRASTWCSALNALAGPPKAIGGVAGRMPILAASASLPVSTSSTPGAPLAAATSIDLILAWACGERST